MPPATRAVKVRRDPPHVYPPLPVGQIRVTVGRYAGRTLAQCPPDFLLWLAIESKSPTYRIAAAELLGLDGAGGEGDPSQVAPPSAESAAIVVPRLAFEWESRVLADLGHVEPGSAEAVALERGVRVMREICSEYTGRAFTAAG